MLDRPLAQMCDKVRLLELIRNFVIFDAGYIWGRRYLLTVVEHDAPPAVKMDHRRITLNVRPGADACKREAIYQCWQRSLLHEAIPPLIAHNDVSA